jgi:hypothetical protein
VGWEGEDSSTFFMLRCSKKNIINDITLRQLSQGTDQAVVQRANSQYHNTCRAHIHNIITPAAERTHQTLSVTKRKSSRTLEEKSKEK